MWSDYDEGIIIFIRMELGELNVLFKIVLGFVNFVVRCKSKFGKFGF